MDYSAKNARLYKVFLKLTRKIRKEKNLLMTEYVKRAKVADQWYKYADKHRPASEQCGEASACQVIWPDVPVINEVMPLMYDEKENAPQMT